MIGPLASRGMILPELRFLGDGAERDATLRRKSPHAG
jgi:hypothetical protein